VSGDLFRTRLADGLKVELRPLGPADRGALAEGYRRLSPESRYQRFWVHTGEVIGERMVDRPRGVLRLQVAFGHVRRMGSAVDKHVIPRRVFRRSRARDLIVPSIGTREFRVDIEDDTAIAEEPMTNQLSDGELCLVLVHEVVSAA